MKNQLLVTADSIRADYCGFLGGPETTPFLDNFASKCVVYENAISPGPRTPSSVPISMTGERFRTNDAETNEGRLERIADHIQRFETIPEQLSRHGYSTGAVTANPWTTGTTGFDELFDEFVEIGTGHGEAQERESTVRELTDYMNQWRKKTDWFAQWPSFYDEVLELTESLEEPWFVWVFLLDPHSPYVVPRQDRIESSTISMYYSVIRYNLQAMRGNVSPDFSNRLDEYIKSSYRDSIRSVDRFLSQITEDVPPNTTLVFHSDHGEAFNDHGTYGHQEQLYEENIHVPLLVHNGDANGRITTPISGRQIPNIINSIANDEYDPQSHTQDVVFSTTEFGEKRAVRTASYKAITAENETRVFNIERETEQDQVQDSEVISLFEHTVASEFSVDAERERVVHSVTDLLPDLQ